MMMTRKIYIILFLFFFACSANAQDPDFGIWYGVSAGHKMSKKIELDLSGNVRTFSNASKIEEVFIEGGLTYNLNKFLSASGSYRLTKKIEDNNSYYFRHKYFADIKGNFPLKNFSFSCRLRYQVESKTYIQDDNDNVPGYTGRVKLKVVYKTPTFPLNPYAYLESFCPMFSKHSGSIGKNRYSAGVDVKVTKMQSVQVEYIFQRDYQPHLSDINVISVNYSVKF